MWSNNNGQYVENNVFFFYHKPRKHIALHQIHKIIRDAPIVSLTDSEPILLLPAAQAETSQPRAHSQ